MVLFEMTDQYWLKRDSNLVQNITWIVCLPVNFFLIN